MKTDKTERTTNIVIDGDTIEEVTDFDYLGSLIAYNGDGIKEIRRRLGMASKKLKSLKKVWNGIDDKTKLKFLRYLIFPVATYGSETLSISKEAEKKINAFEFRCYRKILRIPWTAKKKQMLQSSIIFETSQSSGYKTLLFDRNLIFLDI